MLSDERDEAAGSLFGEHGFTLELGDELQKLRFGRSHRNNQAARFFQLFEERLRQFWSGGGDDDGIEGRMCGKALAAVSHFERNVFIAEPAEDGVGCAGESGVAFDGVHVATEFRQERRLIARAGANFEDGFFGGEIEPFEHEGNDIGLGDGLSFTDGKGVVVVSLSAVGFGDKFVARDAGHCRENALVADAALAELGLDHVVTAVGEVEVENGEGFQGQGSKFQGLKCTASR